MRGNDLNLTADGPTAAIIRTRWISFFIFGLMVALCGLIALVFPRVSTVATGLIVGAALGFAGLFQIAQAFQIRTAAEFAWALLIGAVDVVGGALIYLNATAGPVPTTVLIGAVLLLQGLTQIAFALKARPHAGWQWLLGSAIVALLASAALFLHFPFSDRDAAGLAVGIALLAAGCGYIAIALSARQTDPGAPVKR